MHANIAAYVAFADQCNHPAAIVMQAAAQLPGTLEGLKIRTHREVLLEVLVDARGQVTFVKMLQPAKNRDLDSAAVRSAYASRYSPAMVHCKPKPGQTLFRVVFDPAAE
ncbi:MAG TPA: energy transducer TonB [Candidatus Baltobacteraceae bacterium]|jgi:TonB family protein|nr:energy transducer TonB [Candidatus Baltobacteraceae bacterium]